MTFSNQTSGSELLQQNDYKRGKATRAPANNSLPLNMEIYQQPTSPLQSDSTLQVGNQQHTTDSSNTTKLSNSQNTSQFYV